ncbi:DNA polymerase-3 subunit gamma/tau [Blastomonas natatoria]|uniref:DNA polymerase III subunit gamma/tau n=2 Tax=Blastomonas natatoria TaxID=34015 RepID=A0A2V3UQX4_9SPHN|nr:DNA polymerase III subunit gamma/tau [Blastomonas natatoria]PXW69556.1 DNA polymerase-3 subunit gamma/tau [Blastomonas natatoria]
MDDSRTQDMHDDAAEMPGLGLDLPPVAAPAAPAGQAYRVLARKYRPQTFAELIGQDAMVQTLGNAIRRERLAHAFLMTGVRGVGKTSTARLIAKALNCIGPDGQGGPTISPCGICEPCVAIAEGRHIDVIEMDAASHTGIDDVREITEAVRYAAVSARYKMYIIDEAHMLSKQAWNGLLKTLEEPPPHVKFLFATTEVNKVPITVLSRCQRFDLKRIPSELLASHFAEICIKEAITAEPDALAMIADAAEGSVRDGLSILDQAIAHADLGGDASEGAPQVRAEQVRAMLGLSDRGAMRRLFAHLIAGDADAMLADLDAQHSLGVDPVSVMRGLLAMVHAITLQKSAGRVRTVHGEEDRAALADWAGKLGHASLHRLWQLLLKGHDEIESAPVPREACEMALLRALYASTLPDPGTLARRLSEPPAAPALPPADAPSPSSPPSAAAPPEESPPWESAAPVEPAPRQSPQTIQQLVDMLDQANKWLIAAQVKTDMRLIELGEDRLVYQSATGRDDYVPLLREALAAITGRRWEIERGEGTAQPSLAELEKQAEEAMRDEILNHPLVKATQAAFPDAEIDWTAAEISPHGDETLPTRSAKA